MTTPALGTLSQPGELLTVMQVRDLLKVSRVTVQKWCKEGKLPAVKIGKEYRVRRQDLEVWYESLKSARGSQSAAEHQ